MLDHTDGMVPMLQHELDPTDRDISSLKDLDHQMKMFMDILSDTLDNVNRGCVYRRWPIIN